MGTALELYCQGTALVPDGSFYSFGNGASSAVAVENQAQYKIKHAGTFSKMAVLADNAGTGGVARLRIAGANGNLAVSIPDTTAGLYSDDVNRDYVPANSLIVLSSAVTGNPVWYWVRFNWRAEVGHAAFYATGSIGQVSADSTTTYVNAHGRGVQQTTEANVKSRARTSGTLSNAQFIVAGTPRSTDSTVRSRVSTGGTMANGNIVITLTGGVTGLFEDNAATDTITAGEDWCFSITTGTGGGTLTPRLMAGTIVTTGEARQNDIFACEAIASPTVRAASGTPTFYIIAGRLTGDATENDVKVQHGFPVRTSKFRMRITDNGYSANATATVRKNGADANQVFTITAGADGFYEDPSGTDDFGANEDCCYKIVGGTSGNITVQWAGMTELDLTPSVAVGQSVNSFLPLLLQ